jgi:hypothetical protein
MQVGRSGPGGEVGVVKSVLEGDQDTEKWLTGVLLLSKFPHANIASIRALGRSELGRPPGRLGSDTRRQRATSDKEARLMKLKSP